MCCTIYILSYSCILYIYTVILPKLKLIYTQSLVSCDGGRRPADGLRKQQVRTIRLPMWETLEDFFAILDCT